MKIKDKSGDASPKLVQINNNNKEVVGSIDISNLKKLDFDGIFESVLEQLSDAVILCEIDGTIHYQNKVTALTLEKLMPLTTSDAFLHIFNQLNLSNFLNPPIDKNEVIHRQKLVLLEDESNQLVLQCEVKKMSLHETDDLLMVVLKDITQTELKQQVAKEELKLLQQTYQEVLEKETLEEEQKKQFQSEVESLLLERDLLKIFFNSNHTASIIYDRHYNIKYFNEKANALVMLLNGMYLENNNCISNYHLPCNPNKFEKFTEEALKGKSLKFLSKISINKEKTPKNFEIVFIPLSDELDDEYNYLACNITDVSKQQKRKEQLDLYANVVEHANEAIIVTKANPLHPPGPEIIYVNRATEKLTGHKAEELLGENPRMLQGPKTDRVVLNRIKQALIKGKAIKEEIINYTKLGKPYWVEISITPVFDKIGNILCYVSHQKNITKRKDNELERSTMIRHLLRQNQDLDEFAFITSHNLRAPVARLLGLTDLINYELKENRIPTELLEHIATSANALDEIIRDLNYILGFKRQVGENHQIVFFKDKMEHIHMVLADQIESSKAKIHCDFEACPSIFSIDSYVGNIMEHLVHNAIKYARRNISPEIKIKSFYRDGVPFLTIEDNGLGFPVNISEKDFKLYKRFHPNIPGKGLGLFVVKSHIDMLRGSLQVESKEDEGTTFTIAFPPEIDQPLGVEN